MNSTMWTYFFMVVGILGIVLINLFSDILITNEQSYFILKETTEAAMIDAIDQRGFREGLGWDGVKMETDPESMHCDQSPGHFRILKEKFVESFVRRFAKNVSKASYYKIIFNDIDECPPKVSITIQARQEFPFLEFFNISYQSTGDEIVNSITGIIEEVPVNPEE